MSNQLELRHLRYFMMVAEELHFRNASKRLFITQPGLSRQIKQMEEEMDVQLFSRNKRNVELTEAGQYFKKQVLFMMNYLEDSIKSTQLIHSGDMGEIRIGFVGSAMQNIIPDLLLKMNMKFPGLHSNLEELTNQDQIDALEHNRLDIGFARLNYVPEDFLMKTVFEDTFSLVLPKGHILNEGNFKGVSQLSEESFILFSSDYSQAYYEKIVSICRDQGFTPKVSHKSIHAYTIFKLVENKLGISIVPSSFQHGFDLNVKFIELRGIKQVARLSAIWKRSNKNPALGNFLSLLKSLEK